MQVSDESVKNIIYSEELGSGQFGVVVKCTIIEENGDRRTYASKLPNSTDEFIVERFALKKSQHPLVVKFYSDYSKIFGHIILDYLPLGNLDNVRALLSRDFSSVELRFILDQCVEALTHVHSNTVVHNDVKASNVLMDSNGRIKLADFGSARVCFKLGSQQLYPSDDICCSHLPPEASEGSEFWHAIDWFSLASMIYHLAYGFYPYARHAGMTSEEVDAVFEKTVTFQPSLHPTLVSLLRKMLQLNPHERLGGGLTDGLEILMDKDFSWYYERNGRYSVKKARNFIRRRSFPRLSEILSYTLQ